MVYKIEGESAWRAAEAAGVYFGSAADAADGFIHFSTAGQVKATAEKWFRGRAKLVLAAIDAHKLGSALRFEPARGGELFPHLYGPLPMSAVLWSRPLPLQADGRHEIGALEA